jgi:hypothetical protein
MPFNYNALGAPKVNNDYITNPKFPMPPRTGNLTYMFPGDLVTTERAFYTQIQFVQYQRFSVFRAPFLNPLGGISLPLPKKINDTQTVTWEQIEGGAVAAAIEVLSAGGTAQEAAAALGATAGLNVLPTIAQYLNFGRNITGGIASIAASGLPGAVDQVLGSQFGVSINPFLTMLFKTSNFKEHTLQWTFTPNNEQESNVLAGIINYFKFNMLPSYNGPFLNYPNIALIRFFPQDQFTFKFKPCAVSAVSVDYSGGGMPSFFRNGAPTVVNLAVQLKEIELWTQDDYLLGI